VLAISPRRGGAPPAHERDRCARVGVGPNRSRRSRT
jgi:hypothetical protein